MSRNPVKTSYKRVVRKKKPKYAWVEEHLSHLSPLARYVEENLGEGVTVQELVEQFQEYDCEHIISELAISPTQVFDHCEHCGLITKRKR
jgi:hypothetical protein